MMESAQHLENVISKFVIEAGAVRRRRGANTQLDDAAKILEEAGGHFEATPRGSKAYPIRQLVRQAETGLVGSEYSWLDR
ncbi:hypothetical protein JCM24511_04257 [Saitozyma sp. JCM 24511]|nr:hypothetical protein JCM24511_04257 [Saitozyma sp. JCM 24511]